MEKSIWLRKLCLSMFNQQDSTLSISYRYLMRLTSCVDSVLCLKESHSDDYFSVFLHNGTATVYDLTNELTEEERKAFEKVIENEEACQWNDGYITPLSSSKADHFGYLLLRKTSVSMNDQLREAIRSFGEMVYAELMGGFMLSRNPLIMEAKDLVLRYSDSDKKNVVDHVSLKINKGELTVIMGKSGCGKSSLLNLLAGLLTPNEGEVIWNNQNICTMKEKEKTVFRKDELGYIFQNYNLIGELTAAENVSIAAVLTDKSMPVKQALSLVSLDEYADYYPSQMSGGMQQRVAIARALVKNAAILLCDEPTGALDSENAKSVMTILQNIAHSQDIPVVVVTHNSDYAVLADHYILMKDGNVDEEYYNHFAFKASEVL